MTFSLNNRFVLEAYTKEALKATIVNGMARVEQKTTIKGLKLLVDAKLSDGTIVPAGSKAWIREESLHTAPWAQKIFESASIDGKFIIVEGSFVEYVSPKGE